MINYTVYLSPIAERKFQSILDYIEIEWGKKSKEKFIKNFIDITHQISRFPKSCPVDDKMKEIYKGLVSKHVSLHYHILEEKQEIEIINVFDNRQDPNLIKEIINLFS